MFTGIVEEFGKVASVAATDGGAVLWIESTFASDVVLGESIATNGVCLTVTEVSGSLIRFDLLHETLRVTNLDQLKVGDPVNLERSLRIGDRLSGHFVQGHVDAPVRVLDYSPQGADHRFEVALPEAYAHLVAQKGSICVNGISLTIAEVRANSMVMWIIPHTHEVTNLQFLREGDCVNLEFDLLAKHLDQLLQRRG